MYFDVIHSAVMVIKCLDILKNALRLHFCLAYNKFLSTISQDLTLISFKSKQKSYSNLV